ncbi:MAG TPA: hypothetical protein VK063_03255 [Beutenbergiaceae bacterium]|nr:hypothetical protein [Beutenbergiaceae bacterium]
MIGVLIGAVVAAALALSAAGGYPVTVWVLRRAEQGTKRRDRRGRHERGERTAPNSSNGSAGDGGGGGAGGNGTGAATGNTEPGGPAELHPAEVLRGGTWIGILERLAITGAILVSYPAAIAVVIAVKGLGRFPELTATGGVSERFIIGTLTSGLWAAAVGLAATGALNAIG